MSAKSRIEQLVQEMLDQREDGLFLVGVELSQATNSQKVVVHLDGDQGVAIDACAEISRRLGAIIEEENLISDSFTLEVSSPGLDQPLKLHRQYIKNIGRNVKILLQDNKTLKGTLTNVSEQHVTISEEVKSKGGSKKKAETKEVVIPFLEIKKTNVLASFK